MKRLKFFAIGLLIGGLLVFAIDALAQSIRVGEAQWVRAPVCTSEASATEAAKADSEKGVQAAVAVLNAKDDCGFAQVKAQIVRIVFSAETERGATVRVVEAKVELEDRTWLTLYVLTDVPVKLSGLAT